MWLLLCKHLHRGGRDRYAPLAAAVLLSIVFAPGALGARMDKRLQGPVQAVVERVVDGDTLTVRARIWLGQEIRVNVRIARIDTPELSSRCPRERALAGQARELLHTILYAGAQTEPIIWLRDIDQDKYGGRVLARVTSGNGSDIAETLVAAGLAQSYNGGKRTDWCRI